MSNCTVKFWEDKNKGGHYKTYTNPTKRDDLNEESWDDHDRGDLKDSIGSLQTGSNAWVIVYSQKNYTGRSILIGPNQSKNLKDIIINGEDMDDTLESFKLYDAKPVDTPTIKNNFRKLYPGAVHSQYTTSKLWNITFYAQDSQYRIYDDPTATVDDATNIVDFKLKLDHIQGGGDDHATLTFKMDMQGNFVERIQVEYDMGHASEVPKWAIDILDGAISAAADAAKIMADGAEIVITDGVGVVATVETNELIDLSAKALTFCVDHINLVLKAMFKYQDDGGTMNFSAIVSHSIARLIYAYYEERFGKDTNTPRIFNQQNFFDDLGGGGWDESKHNPFHNFTNNDYAYRAYFPDNSYIYGKGGIVSSVKIDAITDHQKDDHLILQVTFSPDGRLFSVTAGMDIFLTHSVEDYVAPSSGIITYNSKGQMIHIHTDGPSNTYEVITDNSLEAAYERLMNASLNDTDFGNNPLTDQQKHLVDASIQVLNAIKSAFNG